MGHLRLGRLPKTKRWQEVVGLLETTPDDTLRIAGTTLQAADVALREAARNPALGHAFWLLVRIAEASRSSDFARELTRLGLPSDPNTPALQFISAVGQRLQASLTESSGSTV